MSTPAQLLECLGRMNTGTTLCVGDMILDRFVYGRVERISPEGPIPVMEIDHEEVMPGSAGNVVRNVAGLGGCASLVSLVGDDAAGDQLAALLAKLPEIAVTLIRDSERPTSIKTRFIAGTQQLLRADEETRDSVIGSLRKSLLKAVDSKLDNCGAVILSDYGKGVLADGLAAEIIQQAAAKNIVVVVDPIGEDYSTYRGADLITPNRKELATATRRPVDDFTDITRAALQLMNDYDIGAILATLSGDGMLLVRGNGDAEHLPAEAQEVFDVSGAGDTVVAAISLALAAGLDLEVAAEIANTAAGIVVGKLGTAVAYADDVATTLRHRDLASGEVKIVGLPSALDTVGRWRQQGHKIGFTNGCFDLVHPGHVSSLRQAKAVCDRLVVGLNSDTSTARLKGPDRPVQGEMARAAVLASMADVDLVIIFGENSPVALIQALRPEVYVKGADYRIENIPEAKFVQAYGGEVVMAELKDGHSTTATIERFGQ